MCRASGSGETGPPECFTLRPGKDLAAIPGAGLRGVLPTEFQRWAGSAPARSDVSTNQPCIDAKALGATLLQLLVRFLVSPRSVRMLRSAEVFRPR